MSTSSRAGLWLRAAHEPTPARSAIQESHRFSFNGDCPEFCRKLSQKTGKTVSLPTEAQWEYACRAGTKTRFSFGEADADLHKYGNYCDKSNTDNFAYQDKDHDDGHDKTAPVGSYKPNAWGLYDMHGNVWEWCSDWYADSYANAGTRDPQGSAYSGLHVLRGGSWFDVARVCHSASRSRRYPDRMISRYGFRVVNEVTDSAG
jgi:formylglycine-generating enzyme required for sulfatase activity